MEAQNKDLNKNLGVDRLQNCYWCDKPTKVNECVAFDLMWNIFCSTSCAFETIALELTTRPTIYRATMNQKE